MNVKRTLSERFPDGFVGGEAQVELLLPWTFIVPYIKDGKVIESRGVKDTGTWHIVFEWTDKGVNIDSFYKNLIVPFDYIFKIRVLK